jgi:hypothetical protein
VEELGCLLELRLEPLIWFVIWLILRPICLILATPAVLVLSFFGEGSYRTSARKRYPCVVAFWK